MFDGTKIDGPASLRQALLDHSDVFIRNFTEKLMMYGLGRSVEYYDMPAVRAIVRDAGQNNNRFSSFILGIVKRPQFQMRAVQEVTHTRLSKDRAQKKVYDVHHEETPLSPHHASWNGRGGFITAAGIDVARRNTAPADRSRTVDAIRLACIEMVHGAAGATKYGAEKNLWSPAADGRMISISRRAQLLPLEPYREVPHDRQQHRLRGTPKRSNCGEVGADHFRSSAVFLTAVQSET